MFHIYAILSYAIFTRIDATQNPHEKITKSIRIIENRDKTNMTDIFIFKNVEQIS